MAFTGERKHDALREAISKLELHGCAHFPFDRAQSTYTTTIERHARKLGRTFRCHFHGATFYVIRIA